MTRRRGPSLAAGRAASSPGIADRAPVSPLSHSAMAASPQPDAGLRVSLEVDIPATSRTSSASSTWCDIPAPSSPTTPHQLALNVPVALSEALSNAILRGNREDPGQARPRRAPTWTPRASSSRSPTRATRFDLDANTRDATDAGEPRARGRPRTVPHAQADGRRRALRRDARYRRGGNVVRLTLARA